MYVFIKPSDHSSGSPGAESAQLTQGVDQVKQALLMDISTYLGFCVQIIPINHLLMTARSLVHITESKSDFTIQKGVYPV